MNHKIKYILLIIILIIGISIISFFLSSSQARQKGNTEITVRLKWTIQTQFAGYFVALEKGYYQEKGLTVHIKEGSYGKNPLKTVKNEVEEFGVQWASDLIAEGDNFISIANIVKDNGFVLISKKNKGIDHISKFKDHTISTWFIGHEYQLKTLLKKYNLTEKEIKLTSQKWDMSQFYNDEIDVISAMSYNELLDIFDNGYPKNKLNIFNLRDEGVGFPGQNIFTTRSFYKTNPLICEKFVKASIKGWQYAINHPKEAVDIVMKYDYEKELNRDHQYNQMKAMIKLIRADEYPLGIHRVEDYKFISDIYQKYGIIKRDQKIESLFTNEFITGME